mmetsp:Transcript_25947/g.24795  ORF Transcript_25947/g.24795 Transcript_25947/m.24795 type:complete len:322 (-) Transcript_25947:52-1017(-)|eukprot:CAMPEP_0119047368 /NCGR_PEP_ID=MMETSP1177-20130426/52807_1 /TAXON_ID=2985 /ORGANISM="Ochromonas sp, Strain CCMP1899" /LENGTH=321 /DNA_ID=CAMNT_0007021899 /DNA_START=1 /DNA_END=966 /DNA_ORIENTATION=-
MPTIYAKCFSILLVYVSHTTGTSNSLRTEDYFVPESCEKIAEQSDHLLIEYEFVFANGSRGLSVLAPDQLFHMQLSNLDDLPITKALKGMCQNATRDFIWDSALDVNFSPFVIGKSAYSSYNETMTIRVHLNHLTTQPDYLIFDALRLENHGEALEIIRESRGINAVDEWGQSTLMIVVAIQNYAVFAALMNTRRPTVDVNLVKSSGFTALFYAVQHASIEIVQALLRRGADPNSAVLQEGSRGNTPLHFACLLEKIKQIEALLEYGADPFMINQYGQTPFELIPEDTPRSTKLHLQKIFNVAAERMQPSAQIGESRSMEL